MSDSLFPIMKWLDAQHPALKGRVALYVNRCALIAENEQGQVLGLTIFDGKDFGTSFLERLRARRQRPENARMKFSLLVPEFLRLRVDTMKAEMKGIAVEYGPFFEIAQSGQEFKLRRKVRVVNVDDSQVILKLLKHHLEQTGFVEVIEQISDSRHAVTRIQELRPDLITMDIQMPGKTGVEVVQDLMRTDPEGQHLVLMISSVSLEEGSMVFNALNAGAFDYIQKPKLEERETFQIELEQKILLALQGVQAHSALRRPKKKIVPLLKRATSFPENLLWCIGSSTGGTQALSTVFTSLPDQIPATLVVQHIPPVFSRAFAHSLNQLCPFTVKEVEDGDVVTANHVYIAAGAMQMGIERVGSRLILRVKDLPPVNRFKPSVDFMFGEVAKLKGVQIVAGILTGMGRDGAEGLLELRKQGARTFAQDEASSIVYGMPRAAFENGAAEVSVGLDLVAQTLLSHSQPARRAG